MKKMIPDKEQERFRKVIVMMNAATVEGEKEAARFAAERMASSWEMSLEEAIEETHSGYNSGRIDFSEMREKAENISKAWANGGIGMMNDNEARVKYEYNRAVYEAQQRGLNENPEVPNVNAPKVKKKKPPRDWHKRYKVTENDRVRLIKVLLKDGLSLKRVSEVTGASTNEVARVFMHNRGK